MSSIRKLKDKIWSDSIKFRKQSLVGKIFFISLVLLLGAMLIFTALISFMDKWSDLGKYSLWILFGWVFLIVLTYVSAKLISLIMHKEKIEIQELEKTHTIESKKTT
jgi:hypothetical protein